MKQTFHRVESKKIKCFFLQLNTRTNARGYLLKTAWLIWRWSRNVPPWSLQNRENDEQRIFHFSKFYRISQARNPSSCVADRWNIPKIVCVDLCVAARCLRIPPQTSKHQATQNPEGNPACFSSCVIERTATRRGSFIVPVTPSSGKCPSHSRSTVGRWNEQGEYF